MTMGLKIPWASKMETGAGGKIRFIGVINSREGAGGTAEEQASRSQRRPILDIQLPASDIRSAMMP